MEDDKIIKFRILSIDGGGIRGIIPAKLLTELERELQNENPGKKLYEYFDLICGTSTGAIIAIGIAMGIPAANLLHFYKENASQIFPKRYLKIIPRKTRALVASIYDNKVLHKKLKDAFTQNNGGKVPILKDLKTNVCIPTFNGNEGKINVLKTQHSKEYNRDYKLPAHEVALASASAPVYFPPHSFSFSNEYGSGRNINMIDGGIFANNPALIGLLEATEKFGYQFSEISLLSIGTGEGRHIIKKNWRSKNLWYWLLPNSKLFDIILSSQAQITEQYINFLKRTCGVSNNSFEYLRIQYDMGSDIIDLNASGERDINRLEAIGDELAKRNLYSIINTLKSKSNGKLS